MLRTFVERKVRRQIVQRSLIISALGFAAIVVMWNNQALAGVMHPLRMFINNIHGGLSAFAMQISGGAVESFTLSEAGAYTLLFRDGAEALIMSAGYLGSALLGALLFYLVNRAPHLLRGLSIVLGVFTIGFLALFIRPDAAGDWLSLLVCTGFGALLIFLGVTGAGDINRLRSRKSITQIVLSIIALMTALHIVLDLPAVLQTPATSGGAITNPVAYFAEHVMPGLSVEAVAYSWSAIAIALLGMAFHLGIIRPLRQIPSNEDIV
ncbi:MAG: M50 family metallopeptidase [Chloroflexi bacterium]|nr:M50 family metallopeptidase [Chloroflexota bacterium]